eukprot:1159472-Pelagomonas_calceolata.AAC.20
MGIETTFMQGDLVVLWKTLRPYVSSAHKIVTTTTCLCHDCHMLLEPFFQNFSDADLFCCIKWDLELFIVSFIRGTTARHLHVLFLETPSCAQAHARTYPGAAETSPLAADQQQPMPETSGAGSRRRRGACKWSRKLAQQRRSSEVERLNTGLHNSMLASQSWLAHIGKRGAHAGMLESMLSA